ncbi:MAG TPA: serine hydrolase, partial [Aggregatilineales bacterium]|nr:serine hydrolase [Aggregatilineales bacterium]
MTRLRLYSFIFAGIALLCTIPTPLSAAHLASATTPTLTPPPPPIQPLERNIEALAQDYMNGDSHTPGLVVGVIEAAGRNNVQYRGGFYGTISLDSKARPSADTLFEIGSETKVFTATLLAFAVKEGKVKLDDPIQKYLPTGVTAPVFKGKNITLLDLATHRSGFPDQPDNKPSDELKPYTVQDMYDWLSNYKLTYAPGSQWLYSNIGFGLMGTILSRVYVKTYDELITAYLG